MPQLAPSDVLSEVYSPSGDRERVDEELAGFLAEMGRRHATNPHAAPLYRLACESVLRGGKRLRPRLALASYRILIGAADPPARPVWLAASSLELFHAFMLAHDDLIDGSLVRRGEPTLHEAIRIDGCMDDSTPSRKRAGDLGLIAGDVLFALGMGLVGRSGLEPELLVRVHRLLSNMLLETGLGEALDVLYDDCPLALLDESQVLDAYLRKTARYSVSGPLVLGSVLAGASSEASRALRGFGDLLGLGFQLQNDLDALDADDCPDLDAGKRTWLLWKTHERLNASGREALSRALASPAGADRRSRVFDLISQSGSIEECRSRVLELQREAIRVLRESPLDRDRRHAFLGLVELFRLRRS